MNILRAFNPRLYELIQGYGLRPEQDALMPLAYQNIPSGRPLHDDWAVLKSTPRIKTAYRIPLPFKMVKGACQKRWMLWDMDYPQSPDLEIQLLPIWDGEKNQTLPHALVDCAIENTGWSTFKAYINGRWVENAFSQYHRRIFGKLLKFYNGIQPDVTVTFDENHKVKSDLMCWFPGLAMTWVTQ